MYLRRYRVRYKQILTEVQRDRTQLHVLLFACVLLVATGNLEKVEGYITPKKSLDIPIRNQKSHTPSPEILLKNQKSRRLNVEMIYPRKKYDTKGKLENQLPTPTITEIPYQTKFRQTKQTAENLACC